MTLHLGGIHHLTAVTADAPGNVDFYTRILGLRLVKKTVNQDDTSAYHLFYGDGAASAGSDITFFDWPAARERRGTRSVVRTAFRVDAESFDWWAAHLAKSGVRHQAPALLDGRMTLPFEDPEGQRLALIADDEGAEAHTWDRSTVPAEHQIRGLGPITMSVPDLRPTDALLTQVMNMTRARDYVLEGVPIAVYAMGDGGVHAELHVAQEPNALPAGLGAGGVHHVAFRTPDYESLTAWTNRAREFGLRTNGEIERHYFRSLYFREPGGVLFEIATDIPGFTVDEPLETLGENLSLPPFLEHKRVEIERNLKPLTRDKAA